jgi:hypothetical protein
MIKTREIDLSHFAIAERSSSSLEGITKPTTRAIIARKRMTENILSTPHRWTKRRPERWSWSAHSHRWST